MNIQRNKVAVRGAAAAALLLGSTVIACTTTEADPMPGPPAPMGGTPSVLPNGGSAGTTTAGTGGASGGTAAMGAACTAPAECPMGQQCIMMKCGCPGFAPEYCAADLKCSAPMKDPDHCGNCTTKCGATSACNAGACTPEPMPIAEIAGCGTLKLQIAGTTIYALSTMTGALSSMTAPAGGAATPIGTVAGATAFAIDATNAYIVAGMSISKLPLAGGAATVVVTETAPIHDVAVDGATLFYVTGTDVKSIAATAVAGAPAAVVAAIAIDEGEPQGVAASAGHVLYGSNSAMNVESCDLAMACNMTLLDPGPGHTKIGASQGGLIFGHRSVQADATKVYWVNNGVQGAAFAGAEHAALGVAPKDGGMITAFAIQGGVAYFADADENFQKGELGAADPTWLARKVGMVSSIVTDATSAYLASGCKILKAPL